MSGGVQNLAGGKFTGPKLFRPKAFFFFSNKGLKSPFSPKKILNAGLNAKCSGVQGPARPRRRFDKRSCSTRGHGHQVRRFFTYFSAISLLLRTLDSIYGQYNLHVCVCVCKCKVEPGPYINIFAQFFALSAGAWRLYVEKELGKKLLKGIPKTKLSQKSQSMVIPYFQI